MYAPCCPPSPHCLGRVSSHSSCCPTSPYSHGHYRRQMRGAAYLAMPHPRNTSLLTVQLLQGPPGPTSSPFLLESTRAWSNFQTPKGRCFVRLQWLGTLHFVRLCICAKSSTVHTISGIAPNSDQLIYHSLLCHATAPRD